jgi:glycosyltransferase involved in cell wall biosynthesis
MSIKVAYLTNHAAFFESHISPIAINAVKQKFEVKLFCGSGASLEMERYAEINLKKKKIKYEKFNFSAARFNIFIEFFSFIKLLIAIKKYKPTILHAATPKGILYAGLIYKFLKIKGLVLFVSGMGFLFSNRLNIYQKIGKTIYLKLKEFIFNEKNFMLIIENKSDYNYYIKKYKLYNKIKIIKGSGVNISKFKQSKFKKKLIILPARVLKEKGITEFVFAAKILKKTYPDWRFVVLGTLNYEKSSSYSNSELQVLKEQKSVEFMGFTRNILKFYKEASIVCLPSYREGFSKSLIEASACGIPIVTTNVVGCRDVVKNKKTGLLCKPKDVSSLKNKLEFLIKNKNIRKKYGNFAVKIAKKNFDVKIVIEENLKIYKKLAL